ncbi:hypothetical protein D3C79_930710 [compost metagenome]
MQGAAKQSSTAQGEQRFHPVVRVEYLGLDMLDVVVRRLQRHCAVDPLDGREAALLACAMPLHPGQPQLCAGTGGNPIVRVLDQAKQVVDGLGLLLRLAKLPQQNTQLQARTGSGLRTAQRIVQ